MPMPPAAPTVVDRNGLVWGIAIMGLFAFIFCVTIIILLFTITFENNQIASSILAGLSAIFVLVMVGLTFRYDRLTTYLMGDGYGQALGPSGLSQGAGPSGDLVAEQPMPYQPPMYQPQPMPVAAVAVPAVAVAVPAVAVAAPSDAAAAADQSIPPPPSSAPESGGYYYGGHPHYGGNIRYQQQQQQYYR
jgi:hypothetical protein